MVELYHMDLGYFNKMSTFAKNSPRKCVGFSEKVPDGGITQGKLRGYGIGTFVPDAST